MDLDLVEVWQLEEWGILKECFSLEEYRACCYRIDQTSNLNEIDDYRPAIETRLFARLYI